MIVGYRAATKLQHFRDTTVKNQRIDAYSPCYEVKACGLLVLIWCNTIISMEYDWIS